MRFATRAFAFCFICVSSLLGVSFWALQSMVQSSAKEQLRSAMRDKQAAMARLRAKNETQTERFLRFASENTELMAGLQLLNAEARNPEARRTVEDQLEELSAHIGLGLLSVANSRRETLAWVAHGAGGGAGGSVPPAPVPGLAEFRGQLYQMVSAPIDQGDENLGYLTVGEGFDLAKYGVPVVLFQNGRVIRTSQPGMARDELEAAFAACGEREECDIRLGDAPYLCILMRDASLGAGYRLRSLQNVDTAAAPVVAGLRKVFLSAAIAAVLAALVFSAVASRSMARPLADMVSHLQQSEAAGLLMELPADYSRIAEMRELIRSFNRAAASIRDARDGLHKAYVEFVGSLANALDARDRYTAGHSQRVSQVALSIGKALDLGMAEQEQLRVGALLHDIGKIGIPDAVLQKPGQLTDEEFALIEQHPTIGCRILEGVAGFTPYLEVVGLHHENWDGSGYPRGQRGEETPLAARVVHVADAWDAMTTDRPYRPGFSQAQALAMIKINAGTQFDPHIAEVFCRMMRTEIMEECEAILHLASAVGQENEVEAARGALQWEQT